MTLKKALVQVCLSFIICSLSAPIYAEVLPKGVWNFSTSGLAYTFDQIAVETTNGAGDWHYVGPSEFTIGKIPSLATLPASFQGIQLAHNLKVQETYLDINYGFTSKFTAGIRIPHVYKEVNYTDAYISALTSVVNANPAGAHSQGLYIPPKQAVGNGIGDLSLVFKYQATNQFALAGRVSGGLLNRGKDPLEVAPKVDGREELYTGYNESLMSFAGLYDWKLRQRMVHLGLIYEYSSRGYEKILDNNFSTDKGDGIVLTAGTDFLPVKTVSITPQLVYRMNTTDQKFNTTSQAWEAIPNSDTSMLLGGLSVHYRPKVFLDFWATYWLTLRQKAAGGLYESPGRLRAPSYLEFGASVFYR